MEICKISNEIFMIFVIIYEIYETCPKKKAVYPRIWSTHITTPPPSNEAGSSKPRKSHRKKFPQKIPKIPTTIQKFLNITNYVCPWEKSKHPKNRKKI